MVAALGVAEHVRFTGFVSEEEKVRLLRECWVVANTSSKEGWGLTVIEANACRTPVMMNGEQAGTITFPGDRVERLIHQPEVAPEFTEYRLKLTKNASDYLRNDLVRFGGNISRTAQFVGMERSALHRKLKQLGVNTDDRT